MQVRPQIHTTHNIKQYMHCSLEPDIEPNPCYTNLSFSLLTKNTIWGWFHFAREISPVLSKCCWKFTLQKTPNYVQERKKNSPTWNNEEKKKTPSPVPGLGEVKNKKKQSQSPKWLLQGSRGILFKVTIPNTFSNVLMSTSLMSLIAQKNKNESTQSAGKGGYLLVVNRKCTIKTSLWPQRCGRVLLQ